MSKTYKVVTYLLLVCLLSRTLAEEFDGGFVFTGFNSTGLSLEFGAEITSNGLLMLTNTTPFQQGHAFYSNPITLPNTNSTTFSFSTTFVFAIQSEFDFPAGHGLAFFISPSRALLDDSFPAQYLGLFSGLNNRDANKRIVAIELDTFPNEQFKDIDGNHVGLDINGLASEVSHTAGYYAENREFVTLKLVDSEQMQMWIEYDGDEKMINVTLAPMRLPKPKVPLLSLRRDLSEIIISENRAFHVGFSSSTGQLSAYHYILGWSFQLNGQAKPLVLSPLPQLPPRRRRPRVTSKFVTVGIPLIIVFSIIVGVFISLWISFYVISRKRKFAELVEDWELEYGPQRFKYKDLYIATKGFKDKDLLGKGGFGRVFKGVSVATKGDIAVKKISHESRQGMREFVAEIISLGRLRHRNLVPLLGYCRRKGELLLVYDYMPNGSLDKYLFNDPETTLSWSQRFRIIKGVASGLFYLHEEWEQVVVHRDVKASNVLLDTEFNPRLGDFGLARLYDHGTDPQTTHVVGTLGYMAPEHTRTAKATTSTDVFSFGAFLLEVACGRRPISTKACYEEVILVDHVFACWKKGDIVEARDRKMGAEFVAEELELVMKLGLLCSHSDPGFRPSMRQVVEYLERHVALPELSGLGLSANGLTSVLHQTQHKVDRVISFQSSVVDSILYSGR